MSLLLLTSLAWFHVVLLIVHHNLWHGGDEADLLDQQLRLHPPVCFFLLSRQTQHPVPSSSVGDFTSLPRGNKSVSFFINFINYKCILMTILKRKRIHWIVALHCLICHGSVRLCLMFKCDSFFKWKHKLLWYKSNVMPGSDTSTVKMLIFKHSVSLN